MEDVSQTPEGKNLAQICGERFSCQGNAIHGVVGIVGDKAGDLFLDPEFLGDLEEPVGKIFPGVAGRHFLKGNGEASHLPVCRDEVRSHCDERVQGH